VNPPPARPALAARAEARNWNRRVWRLAGPIIVSNITVPLLGIVDTAVVGHLPKAYYLGAVAVGALIFDFLYWGVGFLRMGTTGFTAQAHGAGDDDEIRAALARAALVAGAIAALILILQKPIVEIAMALIEAGPEVERLARAYYGIRVWGAPAALLNTVILGWLLGLQNARASLIVMVAVNGINMALDYLFVVRFGLAVEGVAAASLIAEYAGLAIGAVLVARALGRLDGGFGGGWSRARILEARALRHTIAVNRDIFLRSLCLIAAFAYMTALGARLGDVVLAANAVLMNLVYFMSFGLDGFANAAQALVGRAVGARDRAAYRGVVRASALWALATAAGFAAVYLGAGTQIIDLLTSVAEVRAAARAVLPWLIVAPLIAVWSYQFDGIFFGATRSREMRNAMAVSLALYVATTLVALPLWANQGLWFSFVLFMAARALTLAYYYPRIERLFHAD